MKGKKGNLLGVVLLAIFVIFIVSVVLYGSYSDNKDNNYCEGLYKSQINEPSTFKHSWGEIRNIEKGFIKCCRRVIDNHEKIIECKIFPYIK